MSENINDSKIILEDKSNNFFYKKNKSNLNINFNRIAFIFFIFFVISSIYSIHLIHLGSRNQNLKTNNTLKGDLIKSAFITSSMGVSYKLKLTKNI